MRQRRVLRANVAWTGIKWRLYHRCSSEGQKVLRIVQRGDNMSFHFLSPAEKINQMCTSTSPSHCKLSPPVAAEDGRLDASVRTSLTARIRVSMLSKVAPSRGWEVNQWELSMSRNEYKHVKKTIAINTVHVHLLYMPTTFMYCSLITVMKHCVDWPMRVHIQLRLEVKHISSLLYWLRAIRKMRIMKERHSLSYIAVTGCFSGGVTSLKLHACVHFSPSREVELVQSDRTLQGVGHIRMHFHLLCCLPLSQMF